MVILMHDVLPITVELCVETNTVGSESPISSWTDRVPVASGSP